VLGKQQSKEGETKGFWICWSGPPKRREERLKKLMEPLSSRVGFNALTDRNNVKNHH